MVTAKPRSLPALMASTDEIMSANAACTWLPSTAVIAGPLPRNGTCTMSTPVIILNNSPAMWEVVPIPAEPKLSLPGLALA